MTPQQPDTRGHLSPGDRGHLSSLMMRFRMIGLNPDEYMPAGVSTLKHGHWRFGDQMEGLTTYIRETEKQLARLTKERIATGKAGGWEE